MTSKIVSNAEMWAALPGDLTDTDVVEATVTAPWTVTVTHRDGTRGVHRFDPEDFQHDFVALRDPARFATAQVVEGHTLGWALGPDLVYDIAPDALWLHAHGVCDGACGWPLA